MFNVYHQGRLIARKRGTYEKVRQYVRKLIRATNKDVRPSNWTTNPMISTFGYSIRRA